MRRWILAALLLCASTAFAQTTITIDGSDYEVPDHPRGFLDGPSGTITTRLKDPDGAGALVAPRFVDGDPGYEALKNKMDCLAGGPPYSACAGYETVLHAALYWFGDNSQTVALDFVLDRLSRPEIYINIGAGNVQLGCDVHVNYCGYQDTNHWESYVILYLSQAYSIVHSEMTAGERLSFVRKMLNDVDTNVGEGGCDNQLEQMAITTDAIASGSTTVTGTGFTGIDTGVMLLFKPRPGFGTRGGWAIATNVTDTTITLAGPIKVYSGGTNMPTMASGAIISQLNAMTDTTCGMVWQAGNHISNHNVTFGHRYFTAQAEAIDTTETDILVVDASGFPTPPFLVTHGAQNEIMRVTAVNGNALTVQRSWPSFPGTGSASNSGNVTYNKMLPSGATDSDPRNNRILLKAAAAMMAGIAGLDEMATEGEYRINDAATMVKNYGITKYRSEWTGFTQGGSYYHYAINSLMSMALVDMMRHFEPQGAAPSLDYSQEEWPKRFIYGWIYNGRPDSPFTPDAWGTEGTVDNSGYNWIPFYNDWDPAGEATAHANWRFTEGLYTEANFSTAFFRQALVYALIHMPTTIPETDYRATIPTYRAFNVVDNPPGKPFVHWVSRTGFSSTSDSMITAEAEYMYPGMSDHMSSGSPGSYKFFREGYLLTHNGDEDISAGAGTNMMLLAGASNLKVRSSLDQIVWLDRDDGDDDWAYARIDSTGAYLTTTTATRALRHLIHFKAGTPDFLVVYDDVATSSGKTKSQNLWYDEGCSTFSYAVPDVTCRRSSSSLFTKIIYPTGAALVTTEAVSAGGDGRRVTPCISADSTTCDATNTAGDFLVVHQSSSSAAEAQVTAAALATIDSDFRGVEIGGSNPAVAIFPKVGLTHTSTSFTTTHSGTATYVVTGLAAGAWDVVRGGVTTILDDHVVDGDQVLSFTSVAGAFTVSQGAPPPPEITITTTSLPNHVEDVAGYSQTLAYSGGTAPVAWTIQSGSLCAGLTLTEATGEIAGTPTTQQTCSFTVLVTDAESQTDTQALSITITAAPAACVITTTSLPSGVRNVAYSQVLASSGCTAPLSWVVTGGTICTGLAVTEATGAVSGTPTAVETCNFTVTLTDNAAAVDGQDLSITIDAPPPATLNINTTFIPDCVYRQACTTTLDATGGTPPYDWTVTAGALCEGQSLAAATGVISGAPTAVETCTFTVQVEDDVAATDTVALSRTILDPPPGLTVQAMPGAFGVVVKFGTRTLDASLACDVAVSDLTFDTDTGEIVGIVATGVSTGGRATRVIALGGLAEDTDHRVDVACGTVASGEASFHTYEAVGGTVDWQYTMEPNAYMQALSAAKLKVYYNLPGEAAASVTEASCSTGCTVTLPLTSGAIYEIRHQWLTAGDVVLSTTRLAPVAVP